MTRYMPWEIEVDEFQEEQISSDMSEENILDLNEINFEDYHFLSPQIPLNIAELDVPSITNILKTQICNGNIHSLTYENIQNVLNIIGKVDYELKQILPPSLLNIELRCIRFYLNIKIGNQIPNLNEECNAILTQIKNYCNNYDERYGSEYLNFFITIHFLATTLSENFQNLHERVQKMYKLIALTICQIIGENDNNIINLLNKDIETRNIPEIILNIDYPKEKNLSDSAKASNKKFQGGLNFWDDLEPNITYIITTYIRRQGENQYTLSNNGETTKEILNILVTTSTDFDDLKNIIKRIQDTKNKLNKVETKKRKQKTKLNELKNKKDEINLLDSKKIKKIKDEEDKQTRKQIKIELFKIKQQIDKLNNKLKNYIREHKSILDKRLPTVMEIDNQMFTDNSIEILSSILDNLAMILIYNIDKIYSNQISDKNTLEILKNDCFKLCISDINMNTPINRNKLVPFVKSITKQKYVLCLDDSDFIGFSENYRDFFNKQYDSGDPLKGFAIQNSPASGKHISFWTKIIPVDKIGEYTNFLADICEDGITAIRQNIYDDFNIADQNAEDIYKTYIDYKGLTPHYNPPLILIVYMPGNRVKLTILDYLLSYDNLPDLHLFYNDQINYKWLYDSPIIMPYDVTMKLADVNIDEKKSKKYITDCGYVFTKFNYFISNIPVEKLCQFHDNSPGKKGYYYRFIEDNNKDMIEDDNVDEDIIEDEETILLETIGRNTYIPIDGIGDDFIYIKPMTNYKQFYYDFYVNITNILATFQDSRLSVYVNLTDEQLNIKDDKKDEYINKNINNSLYVPHIKLNQEGTLTLINYNQDQQIEVDIMNNNNKIEAYNSWVRFLYGMEKNIITNNQEDIYFISPTQNIRIQYRLKRRTIWNDRENTRVYGGDKILDILKLLAFVLLIICFIIIIIKFIKKIKQKYSETIVE